MVRKLKPPSVKQTMLGRYGPKSSAYKDGRATYEAIHMWLKFHYDKSNSCDHCNKKTKLLDWANISGEYKRDRNDFKVLCKSCHQYYDRRKRTHCKRGHKFSEENVFYRPQGYRECRLCVRYLVNLRKMQLPKKGK